MKPIQNVFFSGKNWFILNEKFAKKFEHKHDVLRGRPVEMKKILEWVGLGVY